MDDETTQTEQTGYYAQPLPPEAESIKELVKIAGLIALIFAIIGVIGLIFTFGATIIVVIIDFLIWHYCKKINELIDQRKFKEAKDKTLIWMILGLILGFVIPGILLLIAYIKYDELIRISQQTAAPPPPPS